jgi:hypothetical protein
MTLRKISALVFALACTPVFAKTTLSQLGTVSQSDFDKISEDFTSAASYKAVAPANAQGVTGFDIGVEVTSTHLENTSAWKNAGADISQLPIAKVHVRKGLPFNIDVGASLSSVPNSGIKLWGAEVQYAILPGGVAEPALSVRGAYTKLSGVPELDLSTKSVEVSVSKGFLMLTPYAGVGHVWGDVTPNVGTLQAKSTSMGKYFAGLNANFGFSNVAAEMDRTGKATSYSLKWGFRF